MIEIREATLQDVEQVRELFRLSYGDDYFYPQYYDVHELTKLIYSDESIMLVAIDTEQELVAGTASVVFSISAYNDLVGEFGRLVVRPDYRGHGIGKRLMQARIERVESRLHMGVVENRATHTFSQRISNRFGFVPVGFIPMKLLAEPRESVASYIRHFGIALSLRRNHPRVIPEADPVAALSLSNCQLPIDTIVDDSAAPFPHEDDFEISQLQTEGFASLLRIERGRVRNREVFGPVRLHYGMFQIQSRHSHYLIARRNQQVAGGIGFMMDENEKAARIFELITVDDEPVRYLFSELIDRCQRDYGMEYLEVDVSAYSPRIQRTLLELGFVPVGYMPASVFHEVERLDTIRMVRLFVPFDLGQVDVFESVKPFMDLVIQRFQSQAVLPRVAEAATRAPLLDGLTADQRNRLISRCTAEPFAAGETIYRRGQSADAMHLILAGKVGLECDGRPVAEISTGQCLGETSLLYDHGRPHTMTAVALTDVETARFQHENMVELIRRHPDIGVIIYRNLAADVSAKLKATSMSVK